MRAIRMAASACLVAASLAGTATAQPGDEQTPARGGAERAPAPLTWIDAADVAVAFAKGAPLVETPHYKVHASRRDGAGRAEVHARDTDVIHVLEGSASFVTGGRVREPEAIAPDEIRGAAIDGGAMRTLRAGDVVIVPNGTPHWFREVAEPVVYFVVKVTAPEAVR